MQFHETSETLRAKVKTQLSWPLGTFESFYRMLWFTSSYQTRNHEQPHSFWREDSVPHKQQLPSKSSRRPPRNQRPLLGQSGSGHARLSCYDDCVLHGCGGVEGSLTANMKKDMKSKHYHCSSIIDKRVILNIENGAPDISRVQPGVSSRLNMYPCTPVGMPAIKSWAQIQGSLSNKWTNIDSIN